MRKGQRMRSWETLQLLRSDSSEEQLFFVREEPSSKHPFFWVSMGKHPKLCLAVFLGGSSSAFFLPRATRSHLSLSLQPSALSSQISAYSHIWQSRCPMCNPSSAGPECFISEHRRVKLCGPRVAFASQPAAIPPHLKQRRL